MTKCCMQISDPYYRLIARNGKYLDFKYGLNICNALHGVDDQLFFIEEYIILLLTVGVFSLEKYG